MFQAVQRNRIEWGSALLAALGVAGALMVVGGLGAELLVGALGLSGS